MNIQQLEYFVEASKCLNFTRTAEKFYISQSAVTQQMKNLEEELDVILFKREKKRLYLTEAGQVFAGEAQALIDHTREAIEKVQSVQKGNTGYLEIGYMMSMETDEFPESLHHFHIKYPGIHLNLTRDYAVNLYRDFQNGKYDMIFNISSDQFVYQDVHEIVLKQFGFVVCMPPNHRLASKKIIRQKDLIKEKLIVQNPISENGMSGYVIPGNVLNEELMKNVVDVENDADTVTVLVAAGMGLATMPAMDIDKRRNNLRYIPLDTGGFQVSINLYYRNDNTNPAIPLFAAECEPVE